MPNFYNASGEGRSDINNIRFLPSASKAEVQLIYTIKPWAKGALGEMGRANFHCIVFFTTHIWP